MGYDGDRDRCFHIAISRSYSDIAAGWQLTSEKAGSRSSRSSRATEGKGVIRIRFERTRYAHWGTRSGYNQFVHQLDPQHFRVQLHDAPSGDTDLSWLRPMWPIIKVWIRRGRMPWYSLNDLNAELFTVAASLAGGVDIVHFLDGEHSPKILPKFVRKAGLSNVKTMVTYHQPTRILPEVVDRELLRWIDRIVLVSPSQLPFFLQYVPEDRLHVILHGVDIEFFRPPELRPEGNSFRCITVGHWFREWTVLRTIIRAMPEATFDVVSGAETGVSELPNVRIHRSVPDVELAELYRKADILLLPLVDATANNALLEGMASGLPVVATDLPAVRAYLPEGGALVPNNSVEGFIATLQSLRQDNSRRRAMGRCARARAEELAWPRMVRQYEALYAKAVGRPAIRLS